MGLVDYKYVRIPQDSKYGKGTSLNSLSASEFKSFNSNILGLGDISQDGKYIQTLAAVFDLEGFTAFSNQIDPHLVIPEYLSEFLQWLFSSISEVFKEGEKSGRVTIWGSLPFYAKFLGDGILFLWDTSYSGGVTGIGNIVIRLYRICMDYVNVFLPEISRKVVKPPGVLRCGIARGQVISIGNGEDYVGSCINLASRLQKISQLSFAVSRRGFDVNRCLPKTSAEMFILKKASIRGIGDEELIYIERDEFEALPKTEQKMFHDA
jgi:hypothetical protein